MITTSNYFDKVKTINVSALPNTLKEGHHFTKEITENHKTWEYYKSDQDIKAAVDEYLANLSDHLDKGTKPSNNKKPSKTVSEHEAREAAKKLIRSYVLRGDSVESLRSGQMGSSSDEYSASIRANKIEVLKVNGKPSDWKFTLQSIYNEILDESGNTKAKQVQSNAPKYNPVKKSNPKKHYSQKEPVVKGKTTQKDPDQVERIIEEVKFIKRFVLLQNKEKTNSQILNFINQLQKAIVEKRIRKISPYKNYINIIQSALIKFYKDMGKKGKIPAQNERILEKMIEISGSEKVRLSVSFMKRYIGIHGKLITKEKAKTLYNLIVDAIDKGKIKNNDPYLKKIHEVLTSLKHFYELAKRNETIEIHDAVLSGIDNALSGCIGCVECDEMKHKNFKKNKTLSGLENQGNIKEKTFQKDGVMTVEQARKAQFRVVGLEGEYLKLIGKMCLPTSILVYGLGGSRKTSFVLLFTQYLSSLGYKILYVAGEQFNTPTLTELLNDLNIIVGDNFQIVKDLAILNPKDFDFVVLDSKDDMDIGLQQFVSLKQKFPNQSFIIISQATKDGDFTGNGRWRNVVDVMILAEDGIIKTGIDKNRWGGSGEMKI